MRGVACLDGWHRASMVVVPPPSLKMSRKYNLSSLPLLRLFVFYQIFGVFNMTLVNKVILGFSDLGLTLLFQNHSKLMVYNDNSTFRTCVLVNSGENCALRHCK